MEAIYSSKLYKASSRKDKIKAAIADPVNSELVTQLRDYLDEEYQTKDKVENIPDKEDSVKKDAEEAEPKNSEVSNTSTRIIGPSGSSVNMHDTDMNESMDIIEEQPESYSDTEGQDLQDVDQENSEEIESSTSVQHNIKDAKDLLNKCSDTQGVARTAVRNQELWVYYQDSVNLNNVMGPVIDCIESSEFSYLQFSRLARSDNAIVFDIPKEQEVNEYI